MKLKICGLSRPEDIAYVNEAGADYAGFIIDYLKSRRCLMPDEVLPLTELLSPDIEPVGVFVDESISVIYRLYLHHAFNIVQLHGHEDNDYILSLRQLMPYLEIWKAFKIRTESDIKACMDSAADMVILDNGYGTGKNFDWSLVKNMNRPFILAGGLTPDNIEDAARLLNPWGIDISSGVETDGYKDRTKILAAAECVRRLNRKE